PCGRSVSTTTTGPERQVGWWRSSSCSGRAGRSTQAMRASAIEGKGYLNKSSVSSRGRTAGAPWTRGNAERFQPRADEVWHRLPAMKTGSRKALVAWGGPTRVQGDASIGKRLEAAWEASREDDDTLTHGFHAYPARMHGGLARALLASFGTPGGTLLDPFCGSGTTLVEARVAGMAGVGVDLNPVALHVATTKCELRSPEQRERFRQGLARVVEASLLR